MSSAAPYARLAFDARNVVGESIVWSPEESALYWVDIVGARIHRLEPASGRHDAWTTPELPTSIGRAQGGSFVVGLRQRVCMWHPGGTFETLAVPEPDRPRNRLNEGVVAPDGSYWVGTMADNIGPGGEPVETKEATGLLYRITHEGEVGRLTETAFGITNTMVWLEDGRFITADTWRNALYAFDYDDEAKVLTHRRAFGTPIGRGLPDGSCRTANGEIFNCRVAGGGALARLAPSGELIGYIDLPCTSPTSCTFAGPDMATLFVTSARFGLHRAHLDEHPQEGGLFAIQLDEPGQHDHIFGRTA